MAKELDGDLTKTWPVALGRHSPALSRAIAIPMEHGEWPEGEKVVAARQPEAIAKVLIEAHHPHLAKRPIAYLWVEKISGKGKVGLGKASIASAKVKHFGKVDFVMDLSFTAYKELTSQQRVALVDHELQHFAVDGDTLKPFIQPHDVEEFGIIVERWGLWKPDLKAFGDSVRKSLQGDLFAERD